MAHCPGGGNHTSDPFPEYKLINLPPNFTDGTRPRILQNWRRYTPTKVVEIFRKQYPNIASLSVMLSRMKKDLASLKDPPDSTYLSQIALTKQEYRAIRSDRRKKRGRPSSVQVIDNADEIVKQALMHLLTSDDPKLLLAALFPLTGLRLIDVLKAVKFSGKLKDQERKQHSDFWACQQTRGGECSDRCFLAPYVYIKRALAIVRRQWPAEELTNVQVNLKYAKKIQRILQKSYPRVQGVSTTLFRRFFSVYAYKYFGSAAYLATTPSVVSLLALHFSNRLILDPEPKFPIFQVSNFKSRPS